MDSTVVISLEIELGWGLRHTTGQRGLDRHSPERTAETATLDRLLTLCDELGLPFTFNVVAHLLLETCPGHHGGPHRDAWFDSDPGTDVTRDPLYYAPDLVQKIQMADTDHEVCSHTFSHAPAHEAEVDVLDWELEASAERHDEFGFTAPTSLVPPMHAPFPPGLLREHGVDATRRPLQYQAPVDEPEPPSSILRSVPWRLKHAYPFEVLLRSHPVRGPELVHGVVEHFTTWHASLTAPHLPNGQSEPHRVFQLLPVSLRQSLHERYLRDGIRRAIEKQSCAHYWSHLFNLSNEAQWAPVESSLRMLARERDRGNVTVETMESLTEQIIDA